MPQNLQSQTKPKHSAFKTGHILQSDMQLPTLTAELWMLSDSAPWINPEPIVNIAIKTLGKKSDNPWRLLGVINLLLDIQYQHYTKIYTDGSNSKELNRTAAEV
ncbi:hypothetical protein CHS0354_033921, partial [Potamilus streckersoni]